MSGRVALLSLEPWDEVWRRNQHLSAALVRLGLVQSVVFVEPPSKSRPGVSYALDGITVVRPPLVASPRYGSLVTSAAWVQHHWIRHVDHVWINNAPLGRWLTSKARCYDVTDDWRESAQGFATRRRLVRAEGFLSSRVPTIVCSDELKRRWRARYGVDSVVIPNAVDAAEFAAARRSELPGTPPHFCYVGTLHDERLDVELVLNLARSTSGTVHLVGPDHLSTRNRVALANMTNIKIVGAISSFQVPGWLVSADVLLLPHLVTPFTLSLDAIKAHEYLATDRQIVATPTSGFQSLRQVGLSVVAPEEFVAAALRAVSREPVTRPRSTSWEDRARQFAAAAWSGT